MVEDVRILGNLPPNANPKNTKENRFESYASDILSYYFIGRIINPKTNTSAPSANRVIEQPSKLKN